MVWRSILALPAAGPGFFFSAWILMAGPGWRNEDTGVENFGYVKSRYVTLALRVVMAPAVAVIERAQRTPPVIHTRRDRITGIERSTAGG